MKKTIEFLKEIEKETENKLDRYKKKIEASSQKVFKDRLKFFKNRLSKIQDCFNEIN